MKRWIWPFELQDKIGEGGMGVVYRARYVPKDRTLAVKMLSPDVVDGVFLARFERELEILKTLRHPNIVLCFGGVCEDKQRFYAMELVEGGTLDRLIRERGKLSWEQAVEYGLQMCAALTCAHQHGVVHRDVKPGNFLLTKDGKLKLSDFGLATVLAGRRITAADKTMGTYLYMAPEQIRGQEITPRTDLYALGCVLFEMISGRPPFEGQTPAAILHRHLKEPPARVSAFAPDCPPDLERLILDLLEKDPELRPENAEAVAERLRGASNSLVITAARPEAGVANRPVEAREKPKPAPTVVPPSVLREVSPGWVATGAALLFSLLLAWNLVLLLSETNQDRAVAEWVQALGDESEEVRLTAMEALGRIAPDDPQAIEALTARLKDPEPRMRVAAAKALGQLGRSAGGASSALTRLARTDDRPEVRSQAATSLKKIRDDHSGGLSTGWLLVAILAAVAGFAVFRRARRGKSAGAVESRDGRKLVRAGIPNHNGR